MALKELLLDINTIVSHSRDEAACYNSEIDSRRTFVACLRKIVAKEAPGFTSVMDEIAECLSGALDAEQDVVDAFARFAEDFNDIAARFQVVFRISEEARECKQRVRDIKAKIEKLRCDISADEQRGGAKHAKLSAELQKLIQQKKAAVEACIAKMEEFISAKQRFDEFKIRRLTHAYVNVGSVMKESYGKQLQSMKSVAQLVDTARGRLDAVLNGEELPVAEDNADAPVEEEVPAEGEEQTRYIDTNPFSSTTYNEFAPPDFGE